MLAPSKRFSLGAMYCVPCLQCLPPVYLLPPSETANVKNQLHPKHFSLTAPGGADF